MSAPKPRLPHYAAVSWLTLNFIDDVQDSTRSGLDKPVNDW